MAESSQGALRLKRSFSLDALSVELVGVELVARPNSRSFYGYASSDVTPLHTQNES